MSVDALGNFAGTRLVIFGAGYVGSALAREAAAAGARITALTRNPETAATLAASRVDVVQAELDSTDWHERIAPAQWVVNCVSSAGGGAAGYTKSYVQGMRSIREWLSGGPAPVALVYTSSTSVYPQTSGVVDESTPTAEATDNARVLLEAEELALGARDAGLCGAAVVLRLAGIYGPGRHHVLDQIRSAVPIIPGKGDHLHNLVHRDDIVSAILTALTWAAGGAREVFNVTDGTPVPKQELVRWLAGQLQLPQPAFSGVGVPGRRADPPNRAVSSDKFRRLTGWSPQYADFRAGYRALLGA